MKLGIIGTGLIGASIGLRAKQNGWNVSGFDTDAIAAGTALTRGAIDRMDDRTALYRECETLVLAAPPQATIDELKRMQSDPPAAELVLDVASVKAAIAAAAAGLPAFVATHPLAGSEQSGAAAARADLFAAKPWIYVRPVDRRLETRIQAFIEAMGAQAVATSAQTHDEILALTSHLPQLIATLFSKTVRQDARDERFFGPVARELLRLGHSNPRLWREIFAYNAKNLAGYARRMGSQLEAAARAIESSADEAEDKESKSNQRRA